MEKLEKLIAKYWVVTILIGSISATWALFVPGYYGASDDLHIGWLYELHKTLLLGQIPPRFVPDLSFGFGYPLFNFVFPLPFYISEAFHLLGFSLVDSVKIVFLLSVPLSGIFMYLLLRELIKSKLSLVGALLYIYTPYRAVDLYIRGAIGEIVSFIFLPLIVLSVIKISRSKSLGWIGIGGLALASLVLSHNITAYMFLPFVGLLCVLLFFSNPTKRAYLTRTFFMICLGFLISIYFWWPALTESSLMKYDTVFNFVDHFPYFSQLIKPFWGYGASVPGPGDGMSFFLGEANILILISGIILFLLRWRQIEKEKKIVIGWSLSTITLAIFLMNYRSIPIWNNIPLLPYFQFPWRFLILTTFFIPLLLITFEKLKIEKYLIVILSVIIVLPTASYFRPQDFLGRKDSYYLNRYIPVPFASSEYASLQEEYLRLPKNTLIRPDRIYPRVTGTHLNIKKIKITNGLDAILTVEASKEATINYNKYFFPGWVAKIDNKNVEIKPGLPFGQISFMVPAGVHKIEVSFEETLIKKVLDAISLGSFLVSLWLVKNLWFRLRKIGPSL